MRKLIGKLIGVLLIVAGSLLALLAIVSYNMPFANANAANISKTVLFSFATIAVGALLIWWRSPRKTK